MVAGAGRRRRGGGKLKESRGKGQNNNILMEYIYNVDNKHIFLIRNISLYC